MRIGVLALKEAFLQHQIILAKCGVDAILIIKPDEMDNIDGLIISGSEDNIIGKSFNQDVLCNSILKRIINGMPIFGIGDGMIMLAKEIMESEQHSLGLMDIKVRKDGFRSQKESFSENLVIDALGKATFLGVFIKSPYVESVKPNVGILSEYQGKAVMVRQGNFLAASFHPELTNDLRVSLYFKQMIKDAKK